MRVKWIDEDLFRAGNAVEISMGYRDRLRPLFAGEVTGLEPEFRMGEPPLLVVRGHDRCHRLMRGRKTRTFLNMKDSDIASRIAGDAGLSPLVEDSAVTLDYVIQHNQTDLEFLGGRARRIGYELVVADRTLQFRPRRHGESEVLTLNREVELLEFNPRLSTLRQAPQVELRAWSPKEKCEIISRAGPADESAQMAGETFGPAAAQDAFGDSRLVSVCAPVQGQDEADQLASGKLREMALDYISGDGLCIGEPELRAGTVVKIEGLGSRFSGRYYVTSTDHSLKPGSGYRTAFSVRRNAS
jgi:phage protein D